MSGVHIPSEAGDHAACVVLPVRGEQPGERRDEVHAAVVLYRRGQVLDIRRGLDHLQVVAEPLDQGAGDGDGALEHVVGRLVPDLVAHPSDQAALRRDRLVARVEQQEATGAVGVLGLADREAGLAEQGRLLVAEVPGHRDAGQLPLGVAVHVAGRSDLRQHGPGNAQRLQDAVVPVQGLQVHEQGPAGVADVGDVDTALRATGEVPDAPGVDVAEQHLSPLGTLPDAVDVVQDPFDLGAREVRGDGEARGGPEAIQPALLHELVADLVGAGVLPDDGVVDGLAARLLPDHRGLALIGHADRRDVGSLRARLLEAALDHLLAALPDLERVVLDPTRLGIDLFVLLLVEPNHLALMIEDHEPRARGSLIQCCCVLCHAPSLPFDGQSVASEPNDSAAVLRSRYEEVAPGSWCPALRSPR